VSHLAIYVLVNWTSAHLLLKSITVSQELLLYDCRRRPGMVCLLTGLGNVLLDGGCGGIQIHIYFNRVNN